MKILMIGILTSVLVGCGSTTKTKQSRTRKMPPQAREGDFRVKSLGISIPRNAEGGDPMHQLKESCEVKKLDSSCFVLGAYYEENKQMQPALNYYAIACDKQHMRACLTLGSHLLIRYKKYADARKIFAWTCQANNSIGCHNLGHAQLKLSQPLKARQSFQKACQLKFKNSCIELAYQYLEVADDKKKDPKYLRRSLDIFKEYCAPDDLVSCNQAGDIALLMKNWDEAKAIYSKGCEWGDKSFCSLAQRVLAK